MKLSREQRTKLLRRDDLSNSLILHGLTNALSCEEINKFAKDVWGIEKDIEIRLTVDEVEIDLQEFIDHWQNEVDRLLDEHAERLVSDKFGYVLDLLYDFEEQVKGELRENNR